MDKEYWVKPNEDFIDPEETLMDSVGGISDIEKPVSKKVFSFTIILFAVILTVYFISVFKLQIFQGSAFREAAKENVSLSYYLNPPRGIIYDRQGMELANNISEYELIIITKNLPGSNFDIEYNIAAISQYIDKSTDEIREDINLNSNEAFFVLEKNIDKETMDKISSLDLFGVYFVPVSRRDYLNGKYYSHVIGYINGVTEDDLKDDYYKPRDKIGESGLESQYEKILRGDHGLVIFSKNSDDVSIKEGEINNGLLLNIDYNIQKKLYFSLNNILSANRLKRGAAIIQNPYDGAIIAMVSFPSYDNNIFQVNSNKNEISELLSDKNNSLFNRAIGGKYSPGSTIKPLFALAGLKENVITPNTTINDTKGYITIPNQYDPEIVYIYRDWKIQGLVNLKKALAQSSDIFFYSLGGGYGDIKGIGINKITSYLKNFFADKILGIDIPGEQQGFVPTPEWKEEIKGESWFTGDTYNISIGQGDLVVTPLWLNSYVSVLVNGGELYKPRIVDKIVDENKKTLKVFKPEKISDINIDGKDLSEIKEGMREVVLSGTGKLLLNLPQPVAAKTGTSEVTKGKSSNSLLTVYGPYKNPEFVMTIIIENIDKSQQSVALLAAQDFLNWYLNPEIK